MQPTILENITLIQFIQYVSSEHAAPSTIIVCSSKDEFLHQLQTSADYDLDKEVSALEARNDHDNANDGGDRNIDNSNTDRDPSTNDSSVGDLRRRNLNKRPWMTPNLRLLSKSSTLKLAFCPDVTHLRAYLATYSTLKGCDNDSDNRSEVTYSVAQTEEKRPQEPPTPNYRILAILNLINVHRPTSSFSAQGLNRSLAIAVEAAYHSSSRLLIAECLHPNSDLGRPEDDAVDPALGAAVDTGPQVLSETEPDANSLTPWDDDVSMLNITTKSFGAGERGWVGRTVKVRTIAERWFWFRDGASVVHGDHAHR
ncbi:Hypothetical protein R9X50_00727900 [Acrodontium crateriforme]|uniref:Uncharacterized protein n=1 Tax=Acrodontium crateriforme TaxID=150365 RepID=A0AAQ3MC83_9PEZI|nr:Hypothetical protein R9X50_00727900 [Acrodontium crateriforme]